MEFTLCWEGRCVTGSDNQCDKCCDTKHRGLQELGGGTECDSEVGPDFQKARVTLSPKAQGGRPREEGHSKPYLENTWS